MKPESNRKILACPPKCTARRMAAGMGSSPAVLTNAVWALVHQKKPIVLDEVVVLITKNRV